jgi:hypothetical protein
MVEWLKWLSACLASVRHQKKKKKKKSKLFVPPEVVGQLYCPFTQKIFGGFDLNGGGY